MRRLLLLLILALVLVGAIPLAMRGPNLHHFADPTPSSTANPVADSETLCVATFNLAHLRGHGRHQIVTTAAARQRYLKALDQTLSDHDIALLALQEVDGPSWWSGGLDMADLIASSRDWTACLRSSSVRGLGLDYGNALLSRFRLRHGQAITWPGVWAAAPKGALAARLQWGERRLTVVSLHLEPVWTGVRRRQARLLADWLSAWPAPYLVMGDFNTDWTSDGSALRLLAKRLNLRTWPQPDQSPATFDDGRRLDWILVSDPLRLSRPTVIDNTPSDHRLVACTLRWPSRSASVSQ